MRGLDPRLSSLIFDVYHCGLFAQSHQTNGVMRGLDPRIHVLKPRFEVMDHRVEPGGDDSELFF